MAMNNTNGYYLAYVAQARHEAKGTEAPFKK